MKFEHKSFHFQFMGLYVSDLNKPMDYSTGFYGKHRILILTKHVFLLLSLMQFYYGSAKVLNLIDLFKS